MKRIVGTLWGALISRVKSYLRCGTSGSSQALWVFYDLSVSPASFDVATFLYSAELQRQRAGSPFLNVVIVPGPYEGFKAPKAKERNGQGVENLRWRLRNIVVPCCWLLSRCREVMVCSSRKEAEAIQRKLAKSVFPKGYSVGRPTKRPHAPRHLVQAFRDGGLPVTFEAPPMARFYVQQWIQTHALGKKLVIIILRESSYYPDRNSNRRAWSEFAKGLDTEEFCPVFVRDTEAVLGPFPPEMEGFKIFEAACWNVELRAALYELSYLVLFANNGSGSLCTYNRRVRYLQFKMLTPSCGSTSVDYFEGSEVGLPIGFEKWPWAAPFQRLIWEDDTLDVIQREFQKMHAQIQQMEEALGLRADQASSAGFFAGR